MSDLFAPLDTALSTARAAYAAEAKQHQADLAARDAQIAQLQKKLTPATPGIVVGIDISDAYGTDTRRAWPDILSAHRALLGPVLPNVRVYYAPNEALTWDSAKKKPIFDALNGPDEAYVSIKTVTRASWTTWLDKMPAKYRVQGKKIKVAYFHECEGDAKKSGRYAALVADYVATYAMLSDVLASHPNGQYVQLRKILLHYSQVLDGEPRGAGLPPLNQDSWRDFYAGQPIPIDLDVYWPEWTNAGKYEAPEVLFSKLVQIRKETGLNNGVPELGGQFKKGTRTPSERATAMTGAAEYLRAQGFEFVNWWCSEVGYHLEDTPESVAAWKAQMAKNVH